MVSFWMWIQRLWFNTKFKTWSCIICLNLPKKSIHQLKNGRFSSFHCIQKKLDLTSKGLWVPYMDFRDFGHATTIPICNWIFWNFFGGWDIQRASQQQDSDTFCISYDVFFLSFQMRACYQPLPWQPNLPKICPKTISLRNFEIPPNIEILIFFY
jgi:hypothetical protein